MGRMLIYKLIPRGPFHFGERGVGIEETEDFLHSDTLFAAIASGWRAINGAVGGANPSRTGNLDLLEPFSGEGEPPFRISSVFPCAGNILFFPRPRITLGRSKQEKEIAFVSEGALQALCQGREPSGDELLQGGQVWATAEEIEEIIGQLVGKLEGQEREAQLGRYRAEPSQVQLWTGRDEPPTARVSVDRVTSLSELYHEARLWFAFGCGLYFWVDLIEPAYKEHIEAALHFLEDEGLGGRRTSGHGQFHFTSLERPFPEIDEATHQITLSLFHPGHSEVSQAKVLNDGRYDLILRRGWIGSPDGRGLRHRGLRMLTEGSVFPLGSSLRGTIEDVGAGSKEKRLVPHPVWRYGLALTLPFRWEGRP